MRITSRSGQYLATPSSLEGRAIRSRDDHKVGVISSLVLDEQTGHVEYLLVTSGGILGVGEKYHPVPWRYVRFDPETGDYLAEFGRDAIKSSPAYDRDQLSSTAYGWAEQVAQHFEGAVSS